MSNKLKILLILSGAMSVVLLASNFMAAKIWNFFGIPIDGGLLLFPISYVVGDMLVELYGQKAANFVAVVAVVLNAIAMLALTIVVYLPVYPGWDGQDSYAYIFTLSARITIGSLAGYLLSQLTNNWAFLEIKHWQWNHYGFRGFRVRAIGSSMLGRLVDNLIFETIAFLGILPFTDFLKQFAGAYIEGLIVETLMVVLVSDPLIKKTKDYIDESRHKKKIL